jgi:predicted transcriptional regulator
MQTVRKRSYQNSSLEEYIANPENRKEIEAGLDDIKAGRIIWIDPENLWANIK